MVDTIKNIEISEIKTRNKWNIRSGTISTTISDLVESIKAIGVQCPIIVNDRMEIVAGYRRLLACKTIGLKTIPARIRAFASDDLERLSHIDENLQTKSLSEKDIEKALAERKAIWIRLFPGSKKPGLKKEGEPKSFEKETAKITGESEKSIRRKINRVDGASENVRDAYETDNISKSIVDELIKLPINLQDEALSRVLANGLNVAETRLLIVDIISRNKERIIKEAVDEFNKKIPQHDIKETIVETIAEIDVTAIENMAMTKKLISQIKTTNLLLARYLKDECQKKITNELSESLQTDATNLMEQTSALIKALQ